MQTVGAFAIFSSDIFALVTFQVHVTYPPRDTYMLLIMPSKRLLHVYEK